MRQLAPERFVAVAVIAGWTLIGAHLAGSALVGGIAVVLAVMQSITWHRYRTGTLAAELASR